MKSFTLNIVLAFILTLIRCIEGFSQENSPLEITWAKGIGGDRDENAEKIVVDTDGNVYVIGTYEGQILIQDLNEKFSSNGSKDAFILKFNQKGKVIKATSIGGTGSDKINDIEIGADNNIYVGGYFENELIIIGSDKKHVSQGGQDIFWAVLNSDLRIINSFNAGGTSDEEILNINYNSSTGKIYLDGYYRNDINLDPTQKGFYFETKGFSDVFTACYNSDGTCVWANSINLVSITTTVISSLDSKGNINISGIFQGDCDFDPSTNQKFLTSSQGSKDIFLAKYSQAGELLYANKLGGTGLDQIYDMKIDADDNAVICGYFQSLVNFDISNGQKTLNTNGQDGFVASYNQYGELIFANKFKAPSSTPYTLAVDNIDHSIYISGSFYDIADFNVPENPSSKILSAGNSDIFIAHYLKGGKFDYAYALGHTENETSTGCIVYKNNLYLSGYFQGSQTTISTSENIISIGNKGRNDALLLSFNKSTNTERLFSLSGKIGFFERLTEPCEVRLLHRNSNNKTIVVQSFQTRSEDFKFENVKPGIYTLAAMPLGADLTRFQNSYYVNKLSSESANWFNLFGNTSELDLPLITNSKFNRGDNDWVSIDNLFTSEPNTLLINGSESIKESSLLKVFDSRGMLVYEKLFHAQEMIGVRRLELPIEVPGIYTGVIVNNEFEPRTFKFLNKK